MTSYSLDFISAHTETEYFYYLLKDFRNAYLYLISRSIKVENKNYNEAYKEIPWLVYNLL